ncbi:MAG TPA: hypothetical protein VES88_12160 [Gemmatimonadaceae bacterium]|nr:hypothetical protein [Gemmatimonadaceae bacterium]
MNAVARDVCAPASAPGDWRRSLCAQRLVLQSALVRSALNGVGARFRGAILGEELIATLSDRLARSLQGWDTPQSESVPSTVPPRTTVNGNDDAPAMRRIEAGTSAFNAMQSARVGNATRSDGVVERAWVEPGDDSADSAPRAGHIGDADVPFLRQFVDNVPADRAGQILRAVGLDVPSDEHRRDAQRTSPLEAALQRYRQTLERPTSETAANALVLPPTMPRHAERTARGPALSNVEGKAIAAGAPEQSVGFGRHLVTGAGDAPLNEARDPRWWSARVDAIHTRAESFAPAARAGPARFDDDVADESAFADVLAEVLHRQARAYGVAVP